MANPKRYVSANTLYLAGAGTIVGATSITLTSLTDIYGNILTMTDFGDTGYITLEPDTNNEEQATFTGITANTNSTYTLTGVKTSLAKNPYTETSGLVRQHSGGTKIVITDTAAFWNTFTNKGNDETISGQWTFTNTPIVPGSVSDASTTVKGVGKVSVAPVLATNPIFVGDNDPRIIAGGGLLSGIISPYAGSSAPTGWLLCDGSAVSRTTYASLFAITSTTYGAGDTTTTFNVPDLRGRIPVGKSIDTEFDVLGETGGEKTHVLTTPEMPNHTHQYYGGQSGLGTNGSGNANNFDNILSTTTSTGGGTAHNNLQPYITLNYIIKI